MDTNADRTKRIQSIERNALEVRDAFGDYAALLTRFGEIVHNHPPAEQAPTDQPKNATPPSPRK